MPQKHERRLFLRKRLSTNVIFEDEFGEGLFYVRAKDVSIGGILLAGDIPVRMGTLLFLSFSLPPKKRPVRVTGEVVRIKKEASQKSKDEIGIRFMGLSEAARKKLEKFLEY